MRTAFLAALVSLSLVGQAMSQGLAEAAAAEKERRAKERQKGESKTYTNADLEKGQAGKDAKKAESPVAPAPTPTPRAEAEEREDVWRGRAAIADEAVKTAQERISGLEAEIRDLQQDLNPNAPDMLDPNRLQKRAAALNAALQALETAKADLGKAQQEREKLEEEARRKSVPPGWLR